MTVQEALLSTGGAFAGAASVFGLIIAFYEGYSPTWPKFFGVLFLFAALILFIIGFWIGAK